MDKTEDPTGALIHFLFSSSLAQVCVFLITKLGTTVSSEDSPFPGHQIPSHELGMYSYCWGELIGIFYQSVLEHAQRYRRHISFFGQFTIQRELKKVSRSP